MPHKITEMNPDFKFQTMAEVDAYFAQDPLPCLICGGRYNSLHQHVYHTHKMKADEYKEQFGIPWRRGLISASMREKQSAIMNEQRAAGILPHSPSPEHLAKLAVALKNRRPTQKAVRNGMSVHALSTHNREEKLGPADYEEYLRRVASGKTISEVGKEGDLMRRETFDTYCRKNPEFKAKLDEVLDGLPYELQLRCQTVGKTLKTMIVLLRDGHGASWPEIGKALGIKESSGSSIYFRLRKRGELAKYRELAGLSPTIL